MGQVYRYPKVGTLTFNDTEPVGYYIQTLTTDQANARDIIVAGNFHPVNGEVQSGFNYSSWFATDAVDRYIAYYVSNNKAGQWTYNFNSGYMYTYSLATGNENGYRVYKQALSASTGPSQYVIGYNIGAITVSYYDSSEEARAAIQDIIDAGQPYPITYHYTNSTVSGPSEAAIGDTVTVSAVPDVGYGITDASTQILVTNNDVAVPYTWDATNQRITFTMPDPS